MIRLEPLNVGNGTAIGVEVLLPKTTLVVIATSKGYIMCGALDVRLLNDRLKERKIIAGRAVDVKTFRELLDAPLESVTEEAEKLGIFPGITGAEAIQKMM